MNTPTQPWDPIRALFDIHLHTTFDSFTHPGHVGVEAHELCPWLWLMAPETEDEDLALVYGEVH